MKKLYASYLLLMLLAVACATATAPQNFGERLAAGYATATALRDSATSLLDAKRITSDEHKQITDQLVNVRAGLDIARKLQTTDLTQADAKLTALRTGLSALAGYLSTREKGTK